MAYYIFKIGMTTCLVILISEVAKRSSLVGAILASVPVISIMAILWLYIETQDVEKISALSTNVFWLVLPSLVFFIALPILLKNDIHFYLSLFISAVMTVAGYWLMIWIINQVGFKF